MSTLLSGRRVRGTSGQFVAAKEDIERRKEREEKVLDQSVHYAKENEEVAAVGDTAFGPEGADQQFAHTSGRVPVRVPARKYAAPYDLAPTPARGMLRHGLDAAPNISKRDLLDILTVMQEEMAADIITAVTTTLAAERRAAPEQQAVPLSPNRAPLRGADIPRDGSQGSRREFPEDAYITTSQNVAVTSNYSPPSSVASSGRNVARVQKHFMDAIPKYGDYILQDEDMSVTILALAASRLTDKANLWWQNHKTTYSLEDPRRIETWSALRSALTTQFCPNASLATKRAQLHALVQKGSVAAYNTEFPKLSLQVMHLGHHEESDVYLRGLKPEVQGLVWAALAAPGALGLDAQPLDVLQSTALTVGDSQEHTTTAEGLYAGSVGAAARGAAPYKKRKNKKWTGARPHKCFACDQEGHQLRDCIIWKKMREQVQSHLKHVDDYANPK
ncbi:hypothetical protein HDU90_007473 [Geranomyces variabilis]|nr:hypothetical protein HDU90_007473 [Geranomyces variabilis]